MELKEANEKTSQRNSLVWITIIFTLALVFVASLSYYLIFLYPENQVSQLGITNITEKANFVNQYRTTSIQLIATLAQILGGIAVLIGIFFAWKNLEVALATLKANQDKAMDDLEIAKDTLEANQNKAREDLKIAQETLIANQDTAQKNLEVAIATLESNMKNAQKNLEIAQEGQITERFTRAVDQLGAFDKEGNPELEIRLGGIYALERIANESDKDYLPIMEILTAYIRKNSNVEVIVNQKITHLCMEIQANESTTGEVTEGREISLDIQAILTVFVRRQHYYNHGEQNSLNLKRTNLRKSDLSGANLSATDLLEANLSEAYLPKANLAGANLAGANLSGANFYDANLETAFLSGANLSSARLLKANLSKADLPEANLSAANLIEANLSAAGFLKANLSKADFSGANLEKAILAGANLSGANLSEANLSGADLYGANLQGANFQGTNLAGVNFSAAYLYGAKNLIIDQLSALKSLYNATLDDKLLIPLKKKHPALFEEPKW